MNMSTPNLRILLVEDDEDDYLLTGDLLADVEYVHTELTWKDNIDDALRTLESASFDVVLVDFRIGADSGLDFIQKVQKRKITTPCILLTGQGGTDLDARAVALGAADYLVKGQLDGLSLLRSIRYAIDRAAANERLANSEKHYRVLFENNPVPMCLAVPDSGRFVAMNQAAVIQYGLQNEDLGSWSLDDLRGKNARALEAQEQITLREGCKLEHHHSATGRELFVEVLSQKLDWGKTPLDLVMMTDVTQQIDDNNQLKLLRRCIEASFNGITICDARNPDLPLVYANSTFEKITGYSQNEI